MKTVVELKMTKRAFAKYHNLANDRFYDIPSFIISLKNHFNLELVFYEHQTVYREYVFKIHFEEDIEVTKFLMMVSFGRYKIIEGW